VHTLENILTRLQAGAVALSEKGKQELITDICHLFASQPQVSGSQNEALWVNILQTSIHNDLISAVLAEIDLRAFLAWGESIRPETGDESGNSQPVAWFWLNLFRYSALLRRINYQPHWVELVRRLIRQSKFTFNRLFEQRLNDYPSKLLFRVLEPNGENKYTWQQTDLLIAKYARAIVAVLPDRSQKVAFLMENSLDMVLLDLACLRTGYVNVMIPANSVPQQIEFILRQSGASLVFLHDDKQLAKLKSLQGRLPELQKAVLFSGNSIEKMVLSKEEFLRQGEKVTADEIESLAGSIEPDALASIMYTSGTTGDPKGIMFSNMNIVFKRFCRAMALPEIGEQDRFLAYLPLYHTFGRWFEMTGAIFWAAEYNFMENPALSTMLDNMSRSKPTVFISIPKKWYQLYEHITGQVDIEFEKDEVISAAVQAATGGNLRWGLSAAGYLDPEVFLFFQRYHVQLLSGFGMTEATGGITMTYPGEYVANSLGKALPGIEVELAADGELMIRGDYVMSGYYGLESQNETFTDGWFPTGDIMRRDSNGYIEIIDRKKEIYKNIRGETIAPQKIENLFRDFDSVSQVFLVGDHRPFNTVLIYPNAENLQKSLHEAEAPAVRNFFSSLVVTVNKFLAPFERILDFRLTDRSFSEALGELTPKGTYKRRVIEKNFSAQIDEMYQKNYVALSNGSLEVRLPNWFLREKGCLMHDILFRGDTLSVPKLNMEISIAQVALGQIRLGDFVYSCENSHLDLQLFLYNPLYWLGNVALIRFAGEAIFQWYRLDVRNDAIDFLESRLLQANFYPVVQELTERFNGHELSLTGLNLAVQLLQSPDPGQAALAADYLKSILQNRHLPVFPLAAELVRRPGLNANVEVQRLYFRLGLGINKGAALEKYLFAFVNQNPAFLDENLISFLAGELKTDTDITALHALIKNELSAIEQGVRPNQTGLSALFMLMAEMGVRHPTKFKRLRQLQVRYQLREDLPQVSRMAAVARERMRRGFRQWLGDNQPVAVDVETGEEYHWPDVVTFEERISSGDRTVLLSIIEKTPMLREAIFLFSNGNIVRLYDIPLGGVWISQLDDSPDKPVFRISVQTRYQGSYDIVLNMIRTGDPVEHSNEMLWLVHAGAPRRGIRLVEEFGGYWEEYLAWTEEYISGDTVNRFLSRVQRRKGDEPENRAYHLWPFFVRSALGAHLSFWRRSNYQVVLAVKTTENIVIPEHDYQTGVRFVSIARRRKNQDVMALLIDFYRQFVTETEQVYPQLKRVDITYFMLTALFDIEGEETGLERLRQILESPPAEAGDELILTLLRKQAGELIEDVEHCGFTPKNLYFAIRRYHRWRELSAQATNAARASLLNELFSTYQLSALELHYPETRTRFYLETVFKHAGEELREALRDICHQQHHRKPGSEEVQQRFTALTDQFNLSENEQFFLSRLSYPHLKPTDMAQLLSSQQEGKLVADVVVQMEDYDGEIFQVRRPVTPKEISRLHQMFLESNMPVEFRPEHQFLLAIAERGFIIGGLFFTRVDDETVQMEKIVVADRYRRKGISEGLMKEFFERLKAVHIRFVTTGFLRPEYFYRFGFKVEHKYAGLVKDLEKE